MNAVQAVEVTKRYKGSKSYAIDNISLNIEPGRIFTLLGEMVQERPHSSEFVQHSYYQLLEL